MQLIPRDTFVWHQGKVWRYEGLKDCNGRVSLVSLRDPSLGIGAKPGEIRDVDKATEEAVLRYFYSTEASGTDS